LNVIRAANSPVAPLQDEAIEIKETLRRTAF